MFERFTRSRTLARGSSHDFAGEDVFIRTRRQGDSVQENDHQRRKVRRNKGRIRRFAQRLGRRFVQGSRRVVRRFVRGSRRFVRASARFLKRHEPAIRTIGTVVVLLLQIAGEVTKFIGGGVS
jgi:hypothetical protein